METQPELDRSIALEDANSRAQGSPPATPLAVTLFAGVSGPTDPEELRSHASALASSGVLGGAHLVLAYPGSETVRTPLEEGVDLLSYPLPTAEGTTSPWAHTAAAQTALLAIAGDSQAGAVVLLHPDLGALAPGSLMQLAGPVLSRQADLVMASYTQAPFDSLLNGSILAPLTRALYGRRVRFPLAPDLAVSPRLGARLAMSAHNRSTGATPVLWPSMVAASLDAPVTEAALGIQHPSPAGGVDLSTAISQLVGSVFAEMEAHAPLWQRVRASQQSPARPVIGTPETASAAAAGIDTAPMIKSFLLGSRSLQDVWGLVLPPVSLLDLKRLTLLSAERFRMPDELWVRIIYDFALGYRQRTINRTHLLGALTPLYLGWVASLVTEAGSEPDFHMETRLERLARAFEEGKPYLVRRWRWPDRFNP